MIVFKRRENEKEERQNDGWWQMAAERWMWARWMSQLMKEA